MTLPQGVTSNPITTGTVSGTPVVAEFGNFPTGHDVPLKYVTLSANYLQAFPPGYPARPPAGNPTTWPSNTVPNGTRLQLLGTGPMHSWPAAGPLTAEGARSWRSSPNSAPVRS
jgi:hypothetical protein